MRIISIRFVCSILFTAAIFVSSSDAQSSSRSPVFSSPAVPAISNPAVSNPVISSSSTPIANPSNYIPSAGDSTGYQQAPVSTSSPVYQSQGSAGCSSCVGGSSNFGKMPTYQSAVVPGCCGQPNTCAPTFSPCSYIPSYGGGFCFGKCANRPIFGRWSGY